MQTVKLIRTGMRAACGLLIFITAANAADETFEQASVNFVKTYFQRWSSSNTEALTYMSEVFPDEVTYFDKTVNHNTLMIAKRRFAERWPERHFTARAESLRVSCDGQHLCTIWGLVDWDCRSPQRHEITSGTSAFSFQLQDGLAVIAEDGFVVSRGRDLMPERPQITSDTFARAKAAARPDPAPPQTAPVPAVEARQSPAGNYTNDDIPRLREAYFAQSSDRDWIRDWLMDAKQFIGTARSLGPSGLRTLPGLNGKDLHVMQLDTNRGPIACMITDPVPMIALGSDVRIRGTVSIFIDQTMYLADCSFT